MLLEGSCHCGAVRFSVRSRHPYPYQRCYCGICRKTQGGGGYAVNLAADAETFKLTGKKHVTIYHARASGIPKTPGRTSAPPSARFAANAARPCGCSAPSGRS